VKHLRAEQKQLCKNNCAAHIGLHIVSYAVNTRPSFQTAQFLCNLPKNTPPFVKLCGDPAQPALPELNPPNTHGQ
jgi:hypothetical protein